MHGPSFVADLATVLGVAAGTGLLFRWLRQPAVLGYLVAGLIVGPYLPIPIFADEHRVEAMSEFGVVLVMFGIGLEFRLRTLVTLLPRAGLVLLLQVGTMLWAGFSLGRLFGWTVVGSVFLGASIAISSTMLVTKVFEDQPVEGHVRDLVLGTLVLQDVAAVALIAAMAAVAAGEGLTASALASTLGRLGLVLLGLMVAGLVVVPRSVRAVVRLESPEVMTVVAGGLCFLFAQLAKSLGYSVALGAFLAGVLVAESGRGDRLEHSIRPVRDLFAAIFFVSIGMTIDPRLAAAHVGESAVVAAVVIVGFFVATTAGGLLLGNGLRASITAGLALGQIGEFAFIISGVGIDADVVPAALAPIVVTVAVVTAFTTPLALRAADPVVRFVERHLPHRLQHLLHLYAAWLDGAKAQLSTEHSGGRVVRGVALLLIDGAVVVTALALSVAWAPGAIRLGREWADLPPLAVEGILAGIVLLVSLPFLVGAFRTARSLANQLGDAAFARASGATAPLARGALRALVLLAVVLGLGVPGVALLQPFVDGPYVVPFLVVAVVVVAADLWRTAGRVENEIRSGAERVVAMLEMPTAPGETASLPPAATPFPGFDQMSTVDVEPGDHAVGRTLAELDLRARTGATVIAIHREGTDVTIPSGREAFRAGDVLALAGDARALDGAARLLRDGTPPLEDTVDGLAPPTLPSETR